LRQTGREPHGPSAEIALEKAWRHYAARLFPILPPTVTKPEKSRIMRDISIRASGESSATDLHRSIQGPIESLWQRFHSMVRIRTGT